MDDETGRFVDDNQRVVFIEDVEFHRSRSVDYDREMSGRDGRLVYSTAGGRVCPGCGWPADNCRCSKTNATAGGAVEACREAENGEEGPRRQNGHRDL
jgi:hypothetical protein